MISYSPVCGAFSRYGSDKSKPGEPKENNLISYHVQYFGRTPYRGWTPFGNVNCFPFLGLQEYLDKVETWKKQATDNDPEISKQAQSFVRRLKVSTKYKNDWNFAVKEAEAALQCSAKDERFSNLVYQYKETAISSKRKKNNCDESENSKENDNCKKMKLSPNTECHICLKPEADIRCSLACYKSFHLECLGLTKMPKVAFRCVSCLAGRELIQCKSCPREFYGICDQSENFVCDDCQKQKYPQNGMIVMAQFEMKMWPGQIVSSSRIPEHMMAKKHSEGDIVIYFYGLKEYIWTRGVVIAYELANINYPMKLRDVARNESIEVAAEAYGEHLIAESIKNIKQTYKSIKENQVVPPAEYGNRQPIVECNCDKAHPCTPESNCLNRATVTECPSFCKNGELCQNQKFKKRQYALTNVIYTESRGYGLEAAQNIEKGDFVIEYVGEIITLEEYHERYKELWVQGSCKFYFLCIDSKRLIDARLKGNKSRFINHSCEPNCRMTKWSVNGDEHIGIFAIKPIKSGEELTFHYNSAESETLQQCFCGSERCKGYIGYDVLFSKQLKVRFHKMNLNNDISYQVKDGSHETYVDENNQVQKAASQKIHIVVLPADEQKSPEIGIEYVGAYTTVASESIHEEDLENLNNLGLMCEKPGGTTICNEEGCTEYYDNQCAGLQETSEGNSQKKYDLLVIGGGTGGLACAKEASSLGKKVAVLDYVDPSLRGTTWGLGGTCVNVGCIPKKLFHHAALYGKAVGHAKKYGWEVDENATHNWVSLLTSISSYIRSLNCGHSLQLKQKNVDYYNAKGSFVSSQEIEVTHKSGKQESLLSENFVVAVGGRPKYPEIPGAKEYCISSDDLFTLERPPGRTLIIGDSYVALECAGFLTGLGFDTTVMVRSICLRGFDQQMLELVTQHMALEGTQFLKESVPVSVDKDSATGLLKVTWRDQSCNKELVDTFDTVLVAIGREAQTKYLNLESIGVRLAPDSYKIIANNEQTSVPNIYAIGDVLHGKPELTPVAIKAGELLAHRLFNNAKEVMEYDNVATTVFTPLEYGTVGLSEEAAIERFGVDKIEVYHAFYKPLEFNIAEEDSSKCYIKAICTRDSAEIVLGLHLLGPNAGDIIQGFSAAINCGLTMKKLRQTVGIHPTTAEEIVKLNITKRSGLDPTATGSSG